MSIRIPVVAAALLALAADLAGQTPTTLRTVSLLQFLIDSDGAGLFEPPEAYCISDARLDESADPEVLGRLDGRSGRIVPGERCDYDASGRNVLVLDDRTPAILLWARPGTAAETRRSRASIQGAPWEDEVGLMRAGFTSGEMDVEYHCWLRNGAQFDVLHCDTRIVS